MVHRHDGQQDQYRLHQQSGKQNIPGTMPIFNMEWVSFGVVVSFLGEKKKKKKKKGKRGGGGVRSRDKITQFPLWRPVPQGRGVAKCGPDHDQGFILITILAFLARHAQRKRCGKVGPSPFRFRSHYECAYHVSGLL